jgi:20S proteasome subunit beta 4
MDPYGTKVKVPYTAGGLGIYVALSTMDKYWYPDITREEAGHLLKRCIDEVKLRALTFLQRMRREEIES